MNDEVAGKVIEAYKSNPILTGLLALNIGVFIGCGWYINTINHRSIEFVKEQNERIDKLQADLVAMARSCMAPPK
jgi:hypothetical protein